MHMFLQHNTWTFRRRVPGDIQSRLRKREIYKSLATPCRKEARRRAAALFVASEELFELARREDSLTDEELAAIARHWLDQQMGLKAKIDSLPPGQLAEFEGPAPVPPYKPFIYPGTPEMHGVFSKRRRSARLSGILTNAGYQATDERMDQLEPVLKQMTEAYIQQRRQAVFHPDDTEAFPAIAAKLQTAPTVSEVKEKFADHAIEEGRWTNQTRAQNLNSLDLLIRICGDKQLGTFTREDATKLRRTLEKIPSNYGKSPKHYQMPIEQVIAEKKPEIGTLSTGTLDRHWNTIISFIRWGNRLDDVAPTDIDRIFGGLRWSSNAPEAAERLPWEPERLNKLFNSPIWTGFSPHPKKPHWRHEPGETIVRDHRFWLPIMGIYTGARLEELAQLRRCDFQEIDGIHVIQITNEGEGLKLKTKSSKRVVPLHSELVRLGLLRQVEQVASGPIFPEIERGGRDNSLSHFYTEEFTDYRRRVGVYKRWIDFHSFRHNVTTALLRAGVDMLTVDQLTGHDSKARKDAQEGERTKRAGASVTLNYFAGFELRHLRDAIEKLAYPDIELRQHYI